MARRPIDFLNPETKRIWKLLQTATNRSHHDHHRVFRDWLTMATCALSAGQMEELYLQTVKRYGEPLASEDAPRNRAVDAMAEAFGVLVEVMNESAEAGMFTDYLGDLFQGAITFGEAGQYFTPESITRLMGRIAMPETWPGMRVNDPACGSGRTLLSVAERERRAVLYGQDVDSRCAEMLAINLCLYGLRGFAIHCNTITMEVWGGYRVSWGIISPLDKEQAMRCLMREVSERDASDADDTPPVLPKVTEAIVPVVDGDGRRRQLVLF